MNIPSYRFLNSSGFDEDSDVNFVPYRWWIVFLFLLSRFFLWFFFFFWLSTVFLFYIWVLIPLFLNFFGVIFSIRYGELCAIIFHFFSLSSSLSLSASGPPNTSMLTLLMLSYRSLTFYLFHLFFFLFLFFRLWTFDCSIFRFRFIYSFFCHLKSAVKPI